MQVPNLIFDRPGGVMSSSMQDFEFKTKNTTRALKQGGNSVFLERSPITRR